MCGWSRPDLDHDGVDGIDFDTAGNPIAYHILRRHPGDGLRDGSMEADEVSPDSVIHWFRADRPGQVRGVPEILPSLPLYAQLRRYTLAVIAAAETAADFAGILYTDSPADGAEPAEPFEAIELEKRALLTVPGGWKMSHMQAEQPTTTYPQFKAEVLNEIARCQNMPFNVAACNSSGYNYASGRLDHQTYYVSIDVDRHDCETVVLNRIVMAWIDEAVLVGLIPDGLPVIEDWTIQWFWPARPHVDPTKEAAAQAQRLTSHTTTLAYEYATQGRDWEEALQQRAREVSLMRQLGIPLPGAASATNAEDPAKESEDEDSLDRAASTAA